MDTCVRIVDIQGSLNSIRKSHLQCDINKDIVATLLFGVFVIRDSLSAILMAFFRPIVPGSSAPTGKSLAFVPRAVKLWTFLLTTSLVAYL